MRNDEVAAHACTLVQGHKNYYTYLFQKYNNRIINFNSVNRGVQWRTEGGGCSNPPPKIPKF